MALYLTQVTYTPEAWQTMIATPTDRSKMLAKACKSHGGKLIGLWFSMGEQDVVTITEFPDAVSAATLLIAVAAGGSVAASKSTQLLSVAEAMEAMAKAGSSGYKPVGS